MFQEASYTTSQRKQWIDIAKGLGIIAVFYGHSIPFRPPVGTTLVNWIFAFHMPLFFVISGMCFNTMKWTREKTVAEFLRSRFWSLLVPFVLVNALFMALSHIFGWDYYKLSDLTGGKFVPTMWFVAALLMTEVLYWTVQRVGSLRSLRSLRSSTFNKFRNQEVLWLNIALIIVMLPIALVISREEVYLMQPWSVHSVPLSIVFFAVGNMMRMGLESFYKKISTSWLSYLLAAVLLILPMGYVILIPEALGMGKSLIPRPEGPTLLMALSGTMGVLMMSVLMEKVRGLLWLKRMLVYLGRNTLIILPFHMFYIWFDNTFIKPIVGVALAPIYAWALLVPTIYIVNRWLPWLAGKRR